MRRVLTSAGLLALGLALLAPLPAPTHAAQYLQNGGFESGLSSWASTNVDASCTPRSGGGAAGFNSTPLQVAQATQTISITGTSSESFLFKGYARIDSGGSALSVRITWLTAGGQSIDVTDENLDPGPAYAPFQVDGGPIPEGAAAIRVRISTNLNAARICVDDLSLEGPTPATLTPTPVPTLTPTLTATPTNEPSPSSTVPALPTQPLPSQTAAPSSTATKPATQGPSVTPSITPTPLPGFVLVNGGFEDGIERWQKFGGELSAVGHPVAEGSGAAALSSETGATKWAFQVMRVTGTGTYEFQGQLMPGSGVAAAYLRVSWYRSEDASGSAIASADSPVRLAGPAGAYAAVSTGPVSAPPDARSARLRVMLDPAGDGPAVLHMDGFSFAAAESHTATPTVTATATGSASPMPGSTPLPAAQAEGARSLATVAPLAGGASAATPAKVATTSTATAPSRSAAPTPTPGAVPAVAFPDDGGGSPLVWLLGGLALFSLGIVAALEYSKRLNGRT